MAIGWARSERHSLPSFRGATKSRTRNDAPITGDTHPLPSTTATYLAVLALLYTVLAVQVARLRQRERAAFGDNDIRELRSAVRAHANFIEYVPIVALMVACWKCPVWRPCGCPLQFRIRGVGGITLTFVLLLADALAILQRAEIGT